MSININITPIGFVKAGGSLANIKPVIAEFLPRQQIRQPDWSHELMRDYWQSKK